MDSAMQQPETDVGTARADIGSSAADVGPVSVGVFLEHKLPPWECPEGCECEHDRLICSDCVGQAAENSPLGTGATL